MLFLGCRVSPTKLMRRVDALDDTLNDIPGSLPGMELQQVDVSYFGVATVTASDMRQKFVDAYDQDPVYNRNPRLLDELDARTTDGVITRRAVSFEKRGGLLYHIGLDASRRLSVRRPMIKTILGMAQDDTQHFGHERTRRELDGFAMANLSKRADEYIHHCTCQTAKRVRQPPLGNLNPVSLPLSPYQTQAMDFMVGLLKVSSQGHMWHVDGFDEYDMLLTITCNHRRKGRFCLGTSDIRRIIGRDKC